MKDIIHLWPAFPDPVFEGPGKVVDGWYVNTPRREVLHPDAVLAATGLSPYWWKVSLSTHPEQGAVQSVVQWWENTSHRLCVLWGQAGVGKTGLTAGLIRLLLERQSEEELHRNWDGLAYIDRLRRVQDRIYAFTPGPVFWCRWPSLLREMYESYERRLEPKYPAGQRIQDLLRCLLVVLDDADIAPASTPWREDILTTLLDCGHRMLVVMNCHPSQSATVMGQRLADRLSAGRCIEVCGPSRRTAT